MIKPKVLFLCSGNSCRTQMAEAFLSDLAGDRFEITSAGSEATPLDPDAVAAMRELGIDISGHQSKSVTSYLGQRFTFVITVTSFTILSPTQFCTYFYCGVGYVPTVAGHFSSNQGGWNVGGGYQHRMGGMYGESKVKLFAEVRYLDVLSPALTTSPNGLGTTTVGP